MRNVNKDCILLLLPGLEVKEKSRVTFDVADMEEDENDKKLESDVKKRDLKADIMAQQYKYIACLKVSLFQ